MLTNFMSNKSQTANNEFIVHSKMPQPHCEGRIGNKGVATSFVTNTEPALKDLLADGCGGGVVMRFAMMFV